MINTIKAKKELWFQSLEQAHRELKGASIWLVLVTKDLDIEIHKAHIISMGSQSFLRYKIEDDNYPYLEDMYLNRDGSLGNYSNNAKFFKSEFSAVEYAYLLSNYCAGKLTQECRKIERWYQSVKRRKCKE